MTNGSRFVFRLCGLIAGVLALGTMLWAQSLGEIARRQRASKPAVKATRVYDNENLPREGGLSTAEEPQAKVKPGEKKEAEKEAKAKEGDRKELEKAYREKFAKLREALTYEERKLDVLQREFNLASVQFYSNPQQGLQEQQTRAELKTRQGEIEKQKEAVAAAKKAITDLEEQLRKAGLPADWAR